MASKSAKYVLAFDTSNEVIALGVGSLCPSDKSIEVIYSSSTPALRQSNTQLIPQIDAVFADLGISREDIACVCVGRGPGSFTGVRIAMATAKGIASALDASLIGISTQNAIAQEVKAAGFTGRLLVASDAMRKEVYPAMFEISNAAAKRLTSDKVVKVAEFLEKQAPDNELLVTGDALLKYYDGLSNLGEVLSEDLWVPTGRGLLFELQSLWQNDEVDPFDTTANDPVGMLPIYTRLSDAEEAERRKLSAPGERNLVTGVQGNKATGVITEDMAPKGSYEQDAISYRPLDVKFVDDVAAMEASFLGSDAWSASMIKDDLGRPDRTWWMATLDGSLIGYAGARICDDATELLKIVVAPEFRRNGIANALLEKVAYDAFNLASEKMMLEVRASNEEAQAFYCNAGFKAVGDRPKYYSDGEDAKIFSISLPFGLVDEIGDVHESVLSKEALSIAHPLILAVESSCDETAAAIVDGNGRILSNVVSSQIDFHARFGGVVPEIASRKHVEAIVGVARLALEDASKHLSCDLDYSDLDAIGVTYAPGLVGALVVGVAFAKGAAWAANIPLIAVNHLEGHLYANRLVVSCDTNDACDFVESDTEVELPAIVSLVSGGNTMLVCMHDWHDYELLGETIDDAVGEAFDKVAKAMGFPYPGGPQISRLAKQGNPAAIDFPRALMHSGDYRFSLSGLKTAVISYIAKERESGNVLNLSDICASFQQAVIDVQIDKARTAILEVGAKTFCLGGGVAANEELRHAYEQMCESIGVKVIMPPIFACGDNAAMIALVALDRYNQGKFAPLDQDAFAHADLSEPY